MMSKNNLHFLQVFKDLRRINMKKDVRRYVDGYRLTMWHSQRGRSRLEESAEKLSTSSVQRT